MAAEDFVISVDYWFPQRDATRKQLLTVAPVLHDLERNPFQAGISDIEMETTETMKDRMQMP
jgi:hypothetical protein